ncbi:MAG: plasmid mobilization relaxosome protein MobC [Polaromonas sp.]
MAGRNGQVHLSTYVPVELAEAFQALARQSDGGASGALKRLVAQAVEQEKQAQGLHSASAQEAIAPRGVGRGEQVGVRLKATERQALAEAARLQGTSPANWVRSLALVHLARRPQWNPAELEALRALFGELRAIGNNINQMAHALNIAVTTGDYPPKQGTAVREAAERIQWEMRRVVAAITGNFDYWGLPDAERPTAAPGALKRAEAQARAAQAKRKLRPRRRPARFADDD